MSNMLILFKHEVRPVCELCQLNLKAPARDGSVVEKPSKAKMSRNEESPKLRIVFGALDYYELLNFLIVSTLNPSKRVKTI